METLNIDFLTQNELISDFSGMHNQYDLDIIKV